MHKPSNPCRLLPMLLLLLAPAASAQTPLWRCQIDGRWVLSQQPCASPPQGSNAAPRREFGRYGPTESSTAGLNGSSWPTEKAPVWLESMNARCASLHDALRTANARGITPRSRQELQRSYYEQCQEEEYAARERWNRDRAEQRRSAEHSQRQQRAQSERERMQCEGLKDVIRTRSRQASAPTDTGLQRARQAYAERCDGRG